MELRNVPALGWMPWGGFTVSNQPIAPDAYERVDVVFRNGDKFWRTSPRALTWRHEASPGDVVMWRPADQNQTWTDDAERMFREAITCSKEAASAAEPINSYADWLKAQPISSPEEAAKRAEEALAKAEVFAPNCTVERVDMVNHPPHYTQGGIECIDAIRAALTAEEFRGFCKGNAIKYIWREAHKGGNESLEKGEWHLSQLTTAEPEAFDRTNLPKGFGELGKQIMAGMDTPTRPWFGGFASEAHGIPPAEGGWDKGPPAARQVLCAVCGQDTREGHAIGCPMDIGQ